MDLSKNCNNETDELVEQAELLELRTQVQTRLKNENPNSTGGYHVHKGQISLHNERGGDDRVLLRPFAPFVSAELLDFVATVQNHNGRVR